MSAGDHYVEEGLHLFAQGEARRAMALWHKALRISGGDKQVQAIIDHVKERYLGGDWEPEAGALDLEPAVDGAEGDGVTPDTPDGGDSLSSAPAEILPFTLAAARGDAPTGPAEIPEAAVARADVSPSREQRIADRAALRAQQRAAVDEALRACGDDVESLLSAMNALHGTGNPEGALTLADEVIKRDPKREEAQGYRRRTRNTLLNQYLAELGELSRIARVSAQAFEMDWSRVEGHPQAMLVQIDGRTPLEDLIMLGGIPRFEAARTLASMLESGAITLEPEAGTGE